MKEWMKLFDKEHEPGLQEMSAYVGNSMWNDFHQDLQEKYNVKPHFTYSGCSMQPGWNVKYKKSGKSLCTVYPMEGYFGVLVVVGEDVQAEVELECTRCTSYVQEIYNKAEPYIGGKWMNINVDSEEVLRDVHALIQVKIDRVQKV